MDQPHSKSTKLINFTQGFSNSLMICAILFSAVLLVGGFVDKVFISTTQGHVIFFMTMFLAHQMGEVLFNVIALNLSKQVILFEELGYFLGVILLSVLFGWLFYFYVPVPTEHKLYFNLAILFVLFHSHYICPLSPYRKVICKLRPNFSVFGMRGESVEVGNFEYIVSALTCVMLSVVLIVILLT